MAEHVIRTVLNVDMGFHQDKIQEKDKRNSIDSERLAQVERLAGFRTRLYFLILSHAITPRIQLTLQQKKSHSCAFTMQEKVSRAWLNARSEQVDIECFPTHLLRRPSLRNRSFFRR